MSGNSYFLGKLGIGKSGTPTAALDVVGTISGSALVINGTQTFNGAATINNQIAGTVGLTVKGAASQSANLQEWQNSAGTAIARVDANGLMYVGNGQTDGGTTAKLSVATGIYTPGFVWATGGINLTAANTITLGDSATARFTTGLQLASGGPLLKYINASTIQVLQSDGTTRGNFVAGNIGIGKSSPSTALDVVGTISGSTLFASTTLSSSGNLVVKGTSMLQNTLSVRGTMTGYALKVMAGNSYVLGNMEIGSSKAANTALEVEGTASGTNLTASALPSCNYMSTSVAGALQCGATISRDIILSSAGATPQTNSGSVAKNVFLSINQTNVQTQDFTSSGATITTHAAQWMTTMPTSYNGGTMTFTFQWFTPNVAGSVKWFIQCRGYADADNMDSAWGNSGSVISTAKSTANQMIISGATGNVTCGGTPAGGKPMFFRVFRKKQAGDAADTLSGTGRLINVFGKYAT